MWVTWMGEISPVALLPLLSLVRFHGTLFALYLLFIETSFAAFHRLGAIGPTPGAAR